jgi:Arc/MetJ-type ribon-helix-helix transcriptional regulator
MTITLRPEQEKQIAEAINSGAYQSAEDVIARALEILRSEDDWLESHKAEISAKIDRAFEQFERGEFLSASQSREDMVRRKQEWLANNKPNQQ